ncbi:helix-turn-helix domain-containing protein [Streptomyces cellulosae]
MSNTPPGDGSGDAFFASSSSPTRAASTLHVHPNTVPRRLERITELVGADGQHPERALEIQLALRLHRTRRTLRGRQVSRRPSLPGSPKGPPARERGW